MTTARSIVDEALSRGMTREIWTGNYDKVLPVSLQSFELSAVLPAVFYMFRFGVRRGKGKFVEKFGDPAGKSSRERKRAATAKKIADALANSGYFTGFDNEVSKAILADLLLCFCLENANHALGRERQVQRVAPTHYMASWIDLPDSVAHLRLVPEMIVAMLANQDGEYVEQNADGDRTYFPVGRGYDKNILMRAFSQGVKRRGDLADLRSDRFDEEDQSVGLDQLLMVRLAHQLGAAPDKLREKHNKISNQHPIAGRAAKEFSEDIRRFVRSYSSSIPRHSFVELLESCISVGMTTILTSAVRILTVWAEEGEISRTSEQKTAHLFVDCSSGVNREMRAQAEQSMDDFMRSVEHFSIILMALRLLDHSARFDPKIRKRNIPSKPNAAEWINMLGSLLHKRHPFETEAKNIFFNMDQKALQLADQLRDDYPEATTILENEDGEPNPVWRLAESLTLLQGQSSARTNLVAMIDSTLLTNRPNGLAAKRTTVRNVAGSQAKKRRDIRSLVFTDSVLDYLVHTHVLPSGSGAGMRPLSFRGFIRKIRERYGLLVDAAPPGMTISNDLLQTNRSILERRLRDLGLLVGVNDAEAMKRLSPRFEPSQGVTDETD